MRWENERESDNIEDRRDSDGGEGGGFSLGIGRGGIGLGTLAIALIGGWLLGVNPLTLLSMLDGTSTGSVQAPISSHMPSVPADGKNDSARRFVSVVLASTEDVWSRIFQANGAHYTPPGLVLFSNRTPSACGTAVTGAGPFYCPADQKIYLDLAFYRILQQQLGASGDTAQAYVIAHEVGHHVQNLTGTLRQVEQARQQLDAIRYNALSVRVELQADCYAGIWAKHSEQAHHWFDANDIAEAMNAAAAVGDDTLQRRAGGTVRQESFTHGSSRQRQTWFQTGYETGSVSRCNTFAKSFP
ncbi:MAG: neutral zinc metallopeptidase [Lautropia sp.]|nr:neutral zinc metallopeptidase [Lautropia sp.]